MTWNTNNSEIDIKMRKIMFNDKYGLTEAVLEGRKTMTRRVITGCKSDTLPYGGIDGTKHFVVSTNDGVFESTYKVGEVVAVAQRYSDIVEDKFFVNAIAADELIVNAMKYEHGWNNKQGVKACYMPHHIRITGIKVERLKEISEEDCLREGIMIKSGFPRKKSFPYYFAGGKRGWDNSFSTPRKAFAALIDAVSGKGTWENNPWVFAYTFELVD